MTFYKWMTWVPIVYFFDGRSLSFLMKHFLKGIFPLRNWYNKLNKKSKKHKSSPELNFRSRILKFRLRLQKPRSFEASIGYILIIFIIFIIMFLIILTIFFNNTFSAFLLWQLFCTVKRMQKIEKS